VSASGYAVIAGGTGGIGLATADHLLAAGYEVVLADIAVDGFEGHPLASDSRVDVRHVDLRDTAAVDTLLADLIGQRRELPALLVNTSFVPINGKPELLTDFEWNTSLDTNLGTYFRTCRAFGKAWIEAKSPGVIINVSSIAGIRAIGRGSLPYSVCKAAINQMTCELAIEWASFGIRVNAIAPAQVLTPGLEARLTDPEFREGAFEDLMHGIPIGRLGEPGDVAAAIAFLASPAAAFITGVVLPVDGGNLAMNAGATLRSHVTGVPQ
jgi:NAD(P)-dependent dehydrogenase (short-subunit alcohol dehydrogenase family)